MQFKSLACLASFVAIAYGSTVANVLADLANVKTSATTLSNAISAFPSSGGTLTQALAIHTDAGNTETVINTATTDANNVTPKPVSESDGNSVLSAVQGILPIIEGALTTIVQKQPAFAALPVGGIPALVLQDLQTLKSDTDALATALINAAPSDLVSEGTSLKNQIDAAFTTAINAYS